MFWRKPKVVGKVNWLEICQVTVANRQAYGFHSDDCAQAMADAAEKAMANGGTKLDAMSACEAAYLRHFFYSTPHEHPCDEWRWRDVMEFAA